MEFSLQNHEYIELNKLLKIVNLVASGGESNTFITEGAVLVNGEIELQKRKKVRAGDTVVFNETTISVVA